MGNKNQQYGYLSEEDIANQRYESQERMAKKLLILFGLSALFGGSVINALCILFGL